MSEFAEPRRLHKATLAIRALERAPELALGLPVAAYFIGNIPIEIAALIALGGLIFSMVISWIGWLRFTYWIEDEQLMIESGVLSRNKRNIPFDRIQDISLEQKLLARLFGVSVVRIETGSSGTDEGKLDSVSREDADALRDVIRRHRAQQHPVSPETVEQEQGETPSADEPVLFAMSVDRLLVAGLFNFSLIFLAVIGAAFQYFGDLISDQYFDPRYWTGKEGAALLGMVSLFSVVAMIGGLIVVGMVTGILRTFLRDYGFALTRTETGFRRVRGLLTRTDVVMPLRRVQAAIVSTGIIRRLFGWKHLAFQSLGTDGGVGTNHDVAPFAKSPELVPIFDEIDLVAPPPVEAFHKVSSGMIWRSWIEDGLLMLIVMAVVSQFWSWWPVLFIVVGFMAIAPVLQYHAHGWCIDRQLLYVREGVWKPRVTILPLVKIQSVTLQQNVLQQAMNLGSIKIGTAGAPLLKSLTIQDMEIAPSRALLDNQLAPAAC